MQSQQRPLRTGSGSCQGQGSTDKSKSVENRQGKDTNKKTRIKHQRGQCLCCVGQCQAEAPGKQRPCLFSFHSLCSTVSMTFSSETHTQAYARALLNSHSPFHGIPRNNLPQGMCMGCLWGILCQGEQWRIQDAHHFLRLKVSLW